MQEHEKTIISLGIIGASLALGKILASDEPITARLFVGRVILGSGTSMAAAAALVWVPGLSPLAINGLGAALGIAGYQAVEVWLRRRGSSLLKGKKP
ncbi:phage holin family protein [Yersinia enterocolitica]|uniref:phage holin family protein n=1 Tax=Yersinia enterocolitica TaxID=630 RepID=UPI0009F3F37E|nr:phage holin family protein [Yersinia enterocolitica]ELI8162185.1 phage holin family protein [Yersinia enterocolitica]PNM20034.1 holin [Yersinia enterocolitica]HDL7611343.1 phage holin family protein [Yersinia enterocolitica]HDL7732287.1 phage holin family protein [Yersinia enterocolitica]HDL7747743.1 phage holin family protein [Yersinia enterocolitica]